MAQAKRTTAKAKRASLHTSISESEGALMAKPGAAKGKPKHYKRETNAQWRARENKRRRVLEMAKRIAGAVRTRRETSSTEQRQLFEYFERVMRIASSRFDGVSLESESVEDIAQSLRLAAELLEEKPTDGRNFSWHDGKIISALMEAARRVWHDPDRRSSCYEDAILRITSAQPTFSEFLEVYREQNPSVEVEDSSLRRSLRRLGAQTFPEKRGRKPKEK